MTNETAIEIINNCRIAINDGAPFVKLDKLDIDRLYAALQGKPVDVDVELASHEFIAGLKEDAYGAPNAANKREGDYGDWEDWRKALIRFWRLAGRTHLIEEAQRVGNLNNSTASDG